MNKYILGNKIIEATEERYNNTFKSIGYVPYVEKKAIEPKEEVKPEREKRIRKEEDKENNIHGEAKLLLKFLDGSDNRYIIPGGRCGGVLRRKGSGKRRSRLERGEGFPLFLLCYISSLIAFFNN